MLISIVAFVIFIAIQILPIVLYQKNKENKTIENFINYMLILYLIGSIVLSILVLINKEVLQFNYQLLRIELLYCILGLLGIQVVAHYIKATILKTKDEFKDTLDVIGLIEENPVFVIVPVALVPVIEEIVFRFFLMNAIPNVYLAVIISSLIFAIVHSSKDRVSLFFIGLVLAIVYVTTSSILIPIVSHMIMNLCVVIYVKAKHKCA